MYLIQICSDFIHVDGVIFLGSLKNSMGVFVGPFLLVAHSYLVFTISHFGKDLSQ